MSCPACGRDNRPGARFCLDCGAALAAHCAACGVELPADARFCDGCGAPAAAPSQPGVGTQTRKVVTVVFADLADSTSLQEHLDPESVRHMMDRFYGALRAAVEQHGGTTVKLTGDGLMAAFGVEVVAEDDAWRAVQAAEAMQQAFTALGWDPGLSLRVGVNTGEVIVTQGEADVVGDAVNVAARLESAADAGGVLVGEGTWRLTRHLAQFEAVAPLSLKGKAEPVPAYRLLGAADVVVDAGGPFVGREDELARLAALFAEVERDGTVRLAAVIGSPGVGKSRLAAEFVGTLAERANVLEARFSATTASSTFAPVVDALRAALGDDDVGDVLSASPQVAFLAVRRAIETLADTRPVVLVLEDLHWAEPLALDLVEHLVEWTQATPVMLLALARPELREMRPSIVDTAARAAVVTVLEGLDPVASERLACDLLETDALPPALISRILAGSEGNPLFVRELVRMLVDDGVLQLHGSEWRPSIEIDAITVPPTIQSLLAARVERLAADERTVLETAAIVGREFYRGAVAALVPGALRGQLDRILERLRQKEMVEPEGTYWIDEPVLRFHHVLLRDAAYRRVLKEVRADLHERYAGWFEAKAGNGGDNDEALGYHLEQAHQYRMELGLFDERTTILGHRAAERLAAAGRRALDRDDLPAAAGLLGRALARMDGDDLGRPGLLIDRCEALVTTGALADGSLAIGELEALAAGSPRLRAWASCFAAQMAILTDPGQLQETAAVVEHAATELAKLGDAAGAAKAHDVHASALARLGRVAETEAALDRALAAAREAGDTRRATAVLAGAPLAALWGPSPVARASGRCLDVVRVLRITTSATTVEATSLRCQAVLEALRGRTDAARRMLASARRSLEELGHRHGLLSTEMFAGLVELLAEDPVAAEVALQRAHDGFLELGAGADAGQAAALLGRALLAQGRSAEAEELTFESERLGGADLKTAIAWRAVRAEAMARRGSVDEALELANAAVALVEPTDALLDQADTHLAMATVLQLAGRGDDAAASASRAVDLYERKGATVPAERAAALTGHAPNEHDTRPAQTEERRAGTGRLALADNAAMQAVRQSIDGAQGATFELVATRGQHLAVYRTTDELHLVETDADGRLALDVSFARDDLAGAIHGLDERYVSGDPAFGQSWAAALAYIDSLNARAWDDFRAVFAPDFVAVDKRPAGFGTLDGDGMTEWAQGLVAMAPDNWLYAVEVPMISAEGHVTLVVNRGTARGNPFEMVRAVVATVRGDRTTRIEFFEADELDEAHARFEELTAPQQPSSGPAPTRATRAMAELHRVMLARDWQSVRERIAPDIEWEDRRAGFSTRATDRDVYVQNLRTIVELGVRQIDGPVLATRGENLQLRRLVLHGETPDGDRGEVAILQVSEFDDGSRLRYAANFDLDHPLEAYQHLDERYLASLPVDQAAVVEVSTRFVRSYNERAWDEHFGLLSEDFESIDHRPAGQGRLDRAGFERLVLGLVDVASETRIEIIEFAAVTDRGFVAVTMLTGTGGDVGVSEVHRVQLVRMRDGRITNLENWPVEEVDAAVAALHGAAADTHEDVLRVVDTFVESVSGGDTDRLGRLLALDCRIVDHRPVGWGDISHDEFLDLLRSLFALAPDFHARVTTMPRVSERGVVVTMDGVGTDDSGGQIEIANCQLFLVADGRITHQEVFPVDAVDSALARFDELTADSPRPLANACTRVIEQLQRLVVQRDWEGLAAGAAPEVEMADRRPRFEATLFGPDGLVAHSKAMVEVGVTDIQRRPIAVRGERLQLARCRFGGSSGGFEGIVVDEIDDQGRCTYGGLFEADQLAEAFAELDARYLAGEGSDHPSAGLAAPGIEVSDQSAALAIPADVPQNRAWAVSEQLIESWLAHDWRTHAELYAPDATWEDRRPGLQTSLRGRHQITVLSKMVGGVTSTTRTLLATRGERLSLGHAVLVGDDPARGTFEVETLQLLEIDDVDQVIAILQLDPSELGAALDELDRFYAEGEAADAPNAWQIMQGVVRSYNSGDRALFAAHADAVDAVVDHKRLGHGEITGPQFRKMSQLGDGNDSRMTCLAVPRISPRGVVALLRIAGTVPMGGGDWEAEFTVVASIDGDRADHLEFFDPERLDAAIARLDELTR